MYPILAVGDLHLSGKNPPARLDDLTKLQWQKIDNIIEIANAHNCPIICTGDVFNSAVVSNSIVSTMGDKINKLKEHFFFVFGNHDLQYHNLGLLDQTSLGVMWVHNEKVRHISEFEELHGRAWSYIDWRSTTLTPSARYMLAHRAIVNDNLISSNSWILEDRDFCQHVTETQIHDLIICGHWHMPYEFLHQAARNKAVHVLNPGVVCRRAITEREMPAAWLIDLDNPGDYATRVNLNAPEADEVLRGETLKSAIAPHAAEITRFIEQLKMNSLSNKVSFIDNLIKIMEEVSFESGGKYIERELRDIIMTIKARKERYQI